MGPMSEGVLSFILPTRFLVAMVEGKRSGRRERERERERGREGGRGTELLFVGSLTSQQHARVSQGRGGESE